MPTASISAIIATREIPVRPRSRAARATFALTHMLPLLKTPIGRLGTSPPTHDRLHDAPLAQLLTRDFIDDPPTGQDDHAVAQARQLDRVARADDDAHAFVRLRTQAVVDVEPG